MATLLDDNFMVCTDCYIIIGTGDATSFDYYYGDDADHRLGEVTAAIEAVDGHIYPGDSDKDHEFSHWPCECCGTGLAGTRHHCVTLD